MFLDISSQYSQSDEDELDDRTIEAFINAFNAYKSPTRSRHSIRSLPRREGTTRTPTFPGSSVMSALAEKALERSISEISLSSADINIWMSAPSSPFPETDVATLSFPPVASPRTIVPPLSPPPSVTSDSGSESDSDSDHAINSDPFHSQPRALPLSPPCSITSLSESPLEVPATASEYEPTPNPYTTSYSTLNPSTASFHPSSLSPTAPPLKQSLLTLLSKTTTTTTQPRKSTLCLGCEYLVDGGPVEYPHHSFCAFKHDRLLGHPGGTFRCLQGTCGFETFFE